MLDSDGREIGSASRAACHSDASLIHPSVHVVVMTGSGCLWQLRGYGKDSAPGHWDYACSGHVGLGEDARSAAVRELAPVLERGRGHDGGVERCTRRAGWAPRDHRDRVGVIRVIIHEALAQRSLMSSASNTLHPEPHARNDP